MATVHIELPVLVQYKNNQYVIKPLFFPEPSVSNARYEKAMKAMNKAIRNQFQQYKVNRANLNHLLWFLFSPELQFHTFELQFTYGQRYFDGKLSIVWFYYQNKTYACLPTLEHYTFIIDEDKVSPQEMQLILLEQLQQIARNFKKKGVLNPHDEEENERYYSDEYDGVEDFILENYAASKNDYHTTIDLYLHIAGDKINLEGFEDDLMKQFFRQDTEFEGQYEVTKVGYDFNEMYPSELKRAYFVEEAVEDISNMLYNRENVPLVILGKNKVGKTSILHEATYRYLERNNEKTFYTLDNVWHIDPSRLIAGMSIIGMWQRRLESIISFVRNPVEQNSRQDKLYFNNVVALFRIGKSSQNSMTMADVLKPYLETRQLQVVLEATTEEWEVLKELDRGFCDLFKVIRVNEASEKDSINIIHKIRAKLEFEHGMHLDNLALLKLLELQKRFSYDKVLIGAVADSLQQIAIKFRGNWIYKHTIINEFSTKTHLNRAIADSEIKIEKDTFYKYISERLIGQEEAIHCMVDLLHTIKAQLNNPDKPFGSFLFIGPTGVGKTQAAKVLAKYLFTHEDALVRFDMNEFIDSYSVNRLVGDLENPEGQLTSKIRFNPYCVLLFDEIEKAHPDVHNLLLQVLGEGRLTDSLGRTISFNNTIIIMTSNLGAERVGKEINIQRRIEAEISTYEKAVKDFFRPEFINRIDRTVIFHKLEASHIAQIAWLQIKELLNRHGFLRRHTILNVSPEVLENIAKKGFNPEMGGRALKRQIEKELTVLIAEQLAETLPETPIIFNLYLKNEQLLPKIERLEHIPALEKTNLPEEIEDEQKLGVEDFEKLLIEVEKIKEEILAEDDENEVLETNAIDYDSQNLIQIKEKLANCEDRLRNIIWEYETKKEVDLSSTQYQVQSIPGRYKEDGSKGEKTFFRHLYSQLQILEYMEEVAQASNRIVLEANGLYFELEQEVNWLKYFYEEYIENGVDHILLKIDSKIQKAGSEEVLYLHDLYNEFYLSQELVAFYKGKHSIYMYFVGAGVKKLFQQEVGFHNFLVPHETPIPVQVQVYDYDTKLNMTENIEQSEKLELEQFMQDISVQEQTLYVLRLYAYADTSKKKMMITDLRSGLINYQRPSKKDIELWFYANLGM